MPAKKEMDDFDLETSETKTRKLQKIKPAPEAEKPAPKKKAPAKKKPPTSNEPVSTSDGIGDAAREQLRSFVQRIERLEEEKAGIAADIKEVFAEAKSLGYDTKILRKTLAIRKQDPQEREEQQALLDLYLDAVGEYLEMEKES